MVRKESQVSVPVTVLWQSAFLENAKPKKNNFWKRGHNKALYINDSIHEQLMLCNANYQEVYRHSSTPCAACGNCPRKATAYIVRFSWIDTGSKLVVNVIWHQWYLLRTRIRMRNNHLLMICKWYSFMTNSWCHRNVMAVRFDLLLETRWEPSRAPRNSKFYTDFRKNTLCSYTKIWFASCRNREVIRGVAGVFSTEMDYTRHFPILLLLMTTCRISLA